MTTVTTGRRVWVDLYGHTSPGEFGMANTDVLADVNDDRRNGQAPAFAAVALVGAGVLVETRMNAAVS